MPQKQGKIIPNGVSLQKHENDTVVFFTERGFDAELIPESHIPNQHTPDFKIGGREWELKSPIKSRQSTIIHAFHTASRQSENIIFDLRRIKKGSDKVARLLKRLFKTSKKVKKMKIITRSDIIEL